MEDGTDIIDCSVQMSEDAVPFCMDSPDLTKGTTVATMFTTKVANVNEIQNGSGIFSFDLSWSEIQTLKRKYNPIFFATSSHFKMLACSMLTTSFWSLQLTLLARSIKKD